MLSKDTQLSKKERKRYRALYDSLVIDNVAALKKHGDLVDTLADLFDCPARRYVNCYDSTSCWDGMLTSLAKRAETRVQDLNGRHARALVTILHSTAAIGDVHDMAHRAARIVLAAARAACADAHGDTSSVSDIRDTLEGDQHVSIRV